MVCVKEKHLHFTNNGHDLAEKSQERGGCDFMEKHAYFTGIVTFMGVDVRREGRNRYTGAEDGRKACGNKCFFYFFNFLSNIYILFFFLSFFSSCSYSCSSCSSSISSSSCCLLLVVKRVGISVFLFI